MLRCRITIRHIEGLRPAEDAPEFLACLEFLHFAGRAFTAADIMMHFPLKLGAPVAAGAPYDFKVVQSTMPGGPPDM